MRELAEKFGFVRKVWLSRNFGQHAATLAGMASSGGDWIVTMDEDGQHDPAYIGTCWTPRSGAGRVVYAGRATGRPTPLRNPTSRRPSASSPPSAAADATIFHSYRLILGESAEASPRTPVGGLPRRRRGWVADVATRCELRDEGERPSGYSLLAPALAFLAHGAHRRHPPPAGGQHPVSCSRSRGRSRRLPGLWSRVHPAPTEGWTSHDGVLV